MRWKKPIAVVLAVMLAVGGTANLSMRVSADEAVEDTETHTAAEPTEMPEEDADEPEEIEAEPAEAEQTEAESEETELGGEYAMVVPGASEIVQGYSEEHPALDIAAEQGADVIAAEAGTVSLVQYADETDPGHISRRYGSMVKIEHADGNATLYAHLDEICVTQGETVARGQKLGTVGSTGDAGQPMLHLEVITPFYNLDPYPYMTGISLYSQMPISQMRKDLEGGTKYLSDSSLGALSRKKLVGELSSHENDHYYLNTRYVGRDAQSPNGDPSYNGSVGMNCCGFVAYVLRKSGMDPEAAMDCMLKTPEWTCKFNSGKPYDLLAGASNYYTLAKNANVKCYVFDSKQQMLASGQCEKGDVILKFVNHGWLLSGEDNHIGFFWGDKPDEDLFWHTSTFPAADSRGNSGNMITKITEYKAPYILIKLDARDPVPTGELVEDADGKLSYIVDGAVDTGFKGLVKYNGTWYYVSDGKADFGYTGLTRQYGTWFYVENGTVNWNYTGLVKDFGTWFYVENGVINWSFSGLVKQYGTWFFVDKGILNWQYTGLHKQFGTWFYIENSVLDWGYTGLVKDFGTWFYVDKNVLNWQFTGITEYQGAQFYVKRSVLDWSHTGLVPYGDKLLYVEKSVVNTDFVGTVEQDGVLYRVQGGEAVPLEISEEEAYARLTALREEFPDGKYWNNGGISTTPCNHKAGYKPCNKYVNLSSYLRSGIVSNQCFGFAAKLSDAVFTPEAPIALHTDYDRLKVGDDIRLITGKHSFIVLTKTDDYITVAECNGDYNSCIIRWDRKITRAELEKGERVYITRYPEAESDGTAAVGVATANVGLHSGPSTDSSTVATVTKDTRFAVVNREEKYWLVETVDGKRGYVNSGYVKILCEK